MALSRNSRGALLMALAMLGFTFNDALTKTLTTSLNVGQIMLARGVILTFLVYLAARHFGALSNLRGLLQPMVVLRVAFECSSTVLFLLALSKLPLGNVSAILQAMPLAVTVGAAIFFRESVGWHRWTAIIIGFGGILLIIRPGPEGFTAASLLAVATVFSTAGRDLSTKRIGEDVPSLAVTLLTALATTILGGLLVVPLGGWQPMPPTTLAILASAAVLVFIGHQSIIMAMRTGEISFVAPLRYTSLLWAVGIGMFVFGEEFDIWTALGALIVICSGLYTFYREHRRKTTIALIQRPPPGEQL